MRAKNLAIALFILLLLMLRAKTGVVFAQSSTSCLITLSDISMVYDAGKDDFRGTVTIGNDYPCVATMVIRVEGADGLQVSEQIYSVVGDQVTFQLEGSKFKAGQKYIVTAIPLNSLGEIFTTLEQDAEQIVQKKDFVYEPKGPDPLTVEILSVQVDHTSGKLVMDLDINNEEKISSYEGFVTDIDSGSSIYTIDAKLYRGLRIEEPLPATNLLRTASEPHEYRLTLCLNAKDDVQICAEPYEFKPAPAPRITLIQRILKALNNPVTTASVLIVLMSAIGWVIIRNARQSSSKDDLRRPPMDGTDAIPTSKSLGETRRGGGKLYLQVIRSPNSASSKKQQVTNFPFTIGRSGCSLNINDPHISKPHLEISSRGGQFYLKDVGSMNHTYINEQEIQANKLVPIRDVLTVRLGPGTEIEFEPTY